MAGRLAEALIAYIDTHVAVWLHDGLVERLSQEAKRQIEANDLLLSPMALMELQYLFECKKLGIDPRLIFSYLSATFGIRLCQLPFAAVAYASLALDFTRDPFDRLIVANAMANSDAMLISADVPIRKFYQKAVW